MGSRGRHWPGVGGSPQQLVGSGGEVQVKPGQLAVVAATDDVVTWKKEQGATGVASEPHGALPGQGPLQPTVGDPAWAGGWAG